MHQKSSSGHVEEVGYVLVIGRSVAGGETLENTTKAGDGRNFISVVCTDILCNTDHVR